MSTLRQFMESKGFIRIPLKKLGSGHYLFHGKINSIKGDFILDTGASVSCIGLDKSKHFNLIKEPSVLKGVGAGAGDMDTMISKNNNFQLGKKTFRNMEFVLLDLQHINQALMQMDGISVHGIIGADFLKSQRAVIDYGRNCFYFKG